MDHQPITVQLCVRGVIMDQSQSSCLAQYYLYYTDLHFNFTCVVNLRVPAMTKVEIRCRHNNIPQSTLYIYTTYVQCGLWYVVLSRPEFDLRHCLLVLQPPFTCYLCVVTCKLVVAFK